ncbi:hypothetical protein Y032_0773g2237 [Ancylostoma ceylanicum]|uniref:Uncharacterized protein n=1 Tax=Ancylostoma ceylanicum TaxID=53326 RepID=A0A016WF99_9BILA|nr:hypothetical protein Y032_0773g2237 [Ancylostoma ceylanicum]
MPNFRVLRFQGLCRPCEDQSGLPLMVGSFVDVGTSTSGIEAVACVALLFRSMLVQSAYHLKTISLIFGTKTQNSE